jgi:hypothetical protein
LRRSTSCESWETREESAAARVATAELEQEEEEAAGKKSETGVEDRF